MERMKEIGHNDDNINLTGLSVRILMKLLRMPLEIELYYHLN